jgi:hypothetical protein
MRRREFITGFAAVLSLPPLAVLAQSLPKRPLVAVLLGSSATAASRVVSGFLEGMHELDYVDGRNIEITYRYADGDETRMPGIVREAIQLKPDVIVTPNNFAAITAKSATATIPIVCAALLDPVGFGLASGLCSTRGQCNRNREYGSAGRRRTDRGRSRATSARLAWPRREGACGYPLPCGDFCVCAQPVPPRDRAGRRG